MTVREAFLWGREHLSATGVPEAALEAEVLLRHALACDRARLYTQWESALDGPAWDWYRALLDERATGRPVHYILGEREFMGLTFAVDERVLIPRPETEILTELVIDFLRDRDRGVAGSRDGVVGLEAGPLTPDPGPRQFVVDVGTGSGCIAIAIAHFVPAATVIATDISPGALEVATSNARRHGVDGRIEFLAGDVLGPLPGTMAGRCDAVVSNPPYVPPERFPQLPPEIRDFEPQVAVVGKGDGLDVHRRLIVESARWLTPGGMLALEVGVGQADTLRQFLESRPLWTDVRTTQDYSGIDRVVTARHL